MIENEDELRHSFDVMAKMNRLRDRCRSEPLWHPELREDVVTGIENQMRKIEREIAEYLLAREREPERIAA